jgi:hypothetical protein
VSAIGFAMSAFAQTEFACMSTVKRHDAQGGFMNEQSPYLSSIVFFLAGGVAGAGLSLLLAPQSGKATRQMMASRLKVSADSVRELRDRVVTRGEEAWDEAAHRVGEAASALSGVERKDGKRGEAPTAV